MTGTLYFVASPIGNLADMGDRARTILSSVALIACEDTRTSRKLLSHFDIHKPLLACHSHNENWTFQKKILPILQKGEAVAYLSDAGTPGISDPGNVMAELAYQHDIEVVPIPGPSAVSALVSIAGLHGKGFLFEGFLPRKPGARNKTLESCFLSGKACVFFESPHRILRLLEEIASIDAERQVLIGREMTKMHEEYIRGEAENLRDRYAKGEEMIKGEFVVLVYPLKK